MLSVRQWILAAALSALAPSAAAVDPGELLDPRDAFRLTVKGIDSHTAQVEFRIATGYYLYRDRFRFETENGTVITDAMLPRGEMKEDQFFGLSETYHDRVRIIVPLVDVDLEKKWTKLKIVSQGCTDIGVCFIPQEEWVEVRLDTQ